MDLDDSMLAILKEAGISFKPIGNSVVIDWFRCNGLGIGRVKSG
jgi:hypothetical protein